MFSNKLKYRKINEHDYSKHYKQTLLYAVFIFITTIFFGYRGIQLGPFKILEIMLGIFIVVKFFELLKSSSKINLNKTGIFLYLFFMVVLFGVLKNGFTEDTFITIFRLLVGFLVYIIYASERTNIYIDYISKALLFTPVLLFTINIRQIINFLQGSYAGQFTQRMTISNSFGNPNFFSNYLLIPYVLSMHYFITALQGKKIKNVLFNFVTMLISIILILITSSRGSILALILTSTIYLLWYLRKNKFKLHYILLILAIILLVGSLMLTYLDSVINTFFSRISYNDLMEGSGRNVIFSEAIETFIDNPFWGVGLGNFKNISQSGTRTHNLYLELLTETGLIGFLIFFIIIIRIVTIINRIDQIYISYYFSFIAMLLNGFTINMLDLRHFWLIIGVLSSNLIYKNKTSFIEGGRNE